MRNLAKLSLPAIIVVALVVASGCEEQRLRTANRTLSERLSRVEGEKDQLQVDKDKLDADLTRLKNDQTTNETLVAELREENKRKKDALLQLDKLYQDALKKRRPLIVNATLPEELSTALKEFAKVNPNIVEFDDKNGMVKFKSDLTFPPGSAQVNPEAAATLAKLVNILNTDAAKTFAIYVAGHTDDIPIGKSWRRHPTNWYLSVHRAVGVEKSLVKAGMDPRRVVVMGFGEYHPITPNKPNKKGNPKNRRVEIWVVPVGSFLTPDAAK